MNTHTHVLSAEREREGEGRGERVEGEGERKRKDRGGERAERTDYDTDNFIAEFLQSGWSISSN